LILNCLKFSLEEWIYIFNIGNYQNIDFYALKN